MYTHIYLSYFHTGILSPPQWFEITFSNSTLTVSWWAPPSLETSIPPTISHYILNNNITNIPVPIINPAGCKPSMPCNSSLNLMIPSLFIVNLSFYGGKNTTILDNNGTILFTIFAVNGAGNGNATTCIYMVPIRTQGG